MRREPQHEAETVAGGGRPRGRRAALAVCLGLAFLGGCAVGPDYTPPQTPAPESWASQDTAAAAPLSVATPQPADLVGWWRTFKDATLISLTERAIAANLDVKQAQARIRQARASRGVAAAGFWPTINSNVTYRRSLGSTTAFDSSGGGGGTIPTGVSLEQRNLFQVGMDAAWELDIFGGVRRGVEAAEADSQAAVADLRAVLVTMAGEVGTTYINLRGFQQQLAIARQNLEAQRRTAGITRQRYEAGFVSALDVANAEAQAATTEAQIPLLEAGARDAIYTLGVLLGEEPGALVTELTPAAAIPPTPPAIPVGLPSDLLRRRPDISRAEAQLHAATARIGVAKADLFPKFKLTGTFGLSSNAFSSVTDWSSRFWSLGPTVSWPIFAGGKIVANIELQNAKQEEALAAYQKTVITGLKEVESALTAYAKEQEHYTSLVTAVANNRRAVDLSMKLYVHGKTDFLNVLTAQRALYTSEDALTLSRRTLSTNLVTLYKALGGGWEVTP